MKMNKVLLITGAIAIASSVGVYANSPNTTPTPTENFNVEIRRVADSTPVTVLSAEEAIGLGFVNKIDFNNKQEDSEYQSTKINVNDYFYLYTSGVDTLIGSENNVFAKTIAIENSASNSGSINIDVRNSKGQPLGVATNVRPGYYILVDVPALSGEYTINATAYDTNGNYKIYAYDK